MALIPPLPVRIVVAGCGNMSRAWIDYTLKRQDCQIVGLVDPDPEAIRRTKEAYALTEVPTGPDLAAVIRDSKAALVYNLAIPAAHYDITRTAFAAGCAVMSEKPLAESLDQADDLVAKARKNNLFFAVMQNRRYLEQIRSCRRLITDGVIGTPGYYGADFYLGPRFGGFRDLMASPLLLDMAIHTFDQARFLSDTRALSVYCHEFNPPGSWYQGNASAVALFELSDGSVFCYRGSWCAVGCQTSWEADWRITGSNGSIRWDGHTMPWAEIAAPEPDQGVRTFLPELNRVDGADVWHGQERHAGCLDEMFNALLSGRPAETDGTDNRHSLAMVMGAIESARTGRRLSLA
ncbi:MAG: Gfo/Idh/MocA family oxidoreductase [Ruminococcaceae bacterium]|jgi:predicted dehydrogenase|nr:Gfo/Idh/MocA family oxidoreductase [Oscillospiraceae bacterium]